MISNIKPGMATIERISPFRLATNEGNFAKMSDIKLVLACQRREPGAIEQLLERYECVIGNILYRLAPEFVDTSDIRQEVSIKVWRSIPFLKNPALFKGWLKSIVTNLFYDGLRKRYTHFQLTSMDEPCFDEDSPNSTRDIQDGALRPDELALGEELSAELHRALSSIPEQFRTAVLLRDMDGLSYEEIAIKTQSELGTVKSRIARARCKVQKQLVPYLQLTA